MLKSLQPMISKIVFASRKTYLEHLISNHLDSKLEMEGYAWVETYSIEQSLGSWWGDM